MVNRVVLSSDANPAYAFYVPLTALMWREVGGYHPLVLSLGPLPRIVIERTTEIIRNTDIVEVVKPDCCGMQAATQLVRLLAYLAPGVEPDDWLLMGDVDAWPLLAEPFQRPLKEAHLMYDASTQLDIPGKTTPAYPMGYIAARASLWSTWMRVTATTLREGLEMLFLTEPVLTAGGVNADEALITSRIKAWHGHPDRCELVPRSGFPCRGRIDRAAWPANVRKYIHNDSAPPIDAHLLRPGWTDENWPRIRPLLELYLSPKWLAWCDDYRAEWVANA
jgi:hypothetical protein